MANTQKYLNHLLQNVGITPACSEEERVAAEELSRIFSRHGFEPEIQEFTSSSSPKLVRAVLCLLLFIATVLMGVGGVLGIVGALLALACGILYVLERLGRISFPQIGAGGLSQNVIAYHKASGPLASPRNRPVVVVAHYDSPRADLMAQAPLNAYRRLFAKLLPVTMVVPAIVVILRVLPLPDALKIVLWVLAILVALVPLLNAVAILCNRYVLPYTSGSVCNKSSVAAMLGVMDSVSPFKGANEFPDDIPFKDYMAEQQRAYEAVMPVPKPGDEEYAAEELEGEFEPEDSFDQVEQEAAPELTAVPLASETIQMPALADEEPAITAAFEVIDGEGAAQEALDEDGDLTETGIEPEPEDEPEPEPSPVEEEPVAAEDPEEADVLPVNAAGCLRYGVDTIRSLGMVANSCVIEYEQDALPKPKPKAVLNFRRAAEPAPAAEPVARERKSIDQVPGIAPEAAPVAAAAAGVAAAAAFTAAEHDPEPAVEPGDTDVSDEIVRAPYQEETDRIDMPADEPQAVEDPFAYNGYEGEEDDEYDEPVDDELVDESDQFAYEAEFEEIEDDGLEDLDEDDFEEIDPELLDEFMLDEMDEPVAASYEVEAEDGSFMAVDDDEELEEDYPAEGEEDEYDEYDGADDAYAADEDEEIVEAAFDEDDEPAEDIEEPLEEDLELIDEDDVEPTVEYGDASEFEDEPVAENTDDEPTSEEAFVDYDAPVEEDTPLMMEDEEPFDDTEAAFDAGETVAFEALDDSDVATAEFEVEDDTAYEEAPVEDVSAPQSTDEIFDEFEDWPGDDVDIEESDPFGTAVDSVDAEEDQPEDEDDEPIERDEDEIWDFEGLEDDNGMGVMEAIFEEIADEDDDAASQPDSTMEFSAQQPVNLDQTMAFDMSASEPVDRTEAFPMDGMQPLDRTEEFSADTKAPVDDFSSDSLALFRSVQENTAEDMDGDLFEEAPALVDEPQADIVADDESVADMPVEEVSEEPVADEIPEEPLTGATQLFDVASVINSAPADPAQPVETVDSLMAEIERRPVHQQRNIRVPDIASQSTGAVPTRKSSANRSALLDLPDPSAGGSDPFANVGSSDGGRLAMGSTAQFTVVSSNDRPSASTAPAGTFDTIRAPKPVAKKKRRGLFGRKKHEENLNDWLDNDDGWKGGATGDAELTEADLREAVASLGDDELLGHDIWFVATGASDHGNAGIREFLESHRDKLRGVFLINLESIGAGELAMLSTEGERRVLKGDKRIMGLVSRVSSDFHHEIGAVDMPFVDTDAHAAMERSLRSLTIAGVDENGFACSHNQEDMPLNIDTSNIALVADVVTEVIRRS